MAEVKEKTGGNVEVMGQLFSNTRALTTMLSLTGAGAEDFTKSLAAMSDQAGITERVFMDIAKFQSTLPAWGATSTSSESGAYVQISIHAPRVGSDTFG